MSELLPCPFCGADAAELHENPHADMAWVACIVCGLEAPSETGVQAEQAIDYWNSRPDASSQAEIERLRTALDRLVAEHIKRDGWDEPMGSSEQSDAINEALSALSGSKP
jgi:Lar family restriction alleviation protein